MKRKILAIVSMVVMLFLVLSPGIPALADGPEYLNQTRLAKWANCGATAEWNTAPAYIYDGSYSVHGAVPDGETDFFNIVHMGIGNGTAVTMGSIKTVQFMEYLISPGGTENISAAVILFLNEPGTPGPVEGADKDSIFNACEDALTFHCYGDAAPVGSWSLRDLASSQQL